MSEIEQLQSEEAELNSLLAEKTELEQMLKQFPDSNAIERLSLNSRLWDVEDKAERLEKNIQKDKEINRLEAKISELESKNWELLEAMERVCGHTGNINRNKFLAPLCRGSFTSSNSGCSFANEGVCKFWDELKKAQEENQ